MLYQLPCLVTNAWALRETVKPGVNGELVIKGFVEDLATKMLQLLVLRDYTWSAVAGRMSVAYDLFTMRQPFQ